MTDRGEKMTEFERKLKERMEREAAETEAEETVQGEPVDADVAEDEVSAEEEALTPAAVEALVTERDDWKDQALRARAEFDNYRKRVARDAEQARRSAAAGLIGDLLPVMDHLNLALQHAEEGKRTKNALISFMEGVEMVAGQFMEVLNRHGVEPIPAVGDPFDPEVHDALMQTPSEEYPEGVVAKEFQKGYRLGGKVLRHAKVVVSSGPPDEKK